VPGGISDDQCDVARLKLKGVVPITAYLGAPALAAR
jgi:hypothetical protein